MLIRTKQKMREYFHERCIAYNRAFDKQSPFTQTVMDDLAKFCRANESTYHVDARAHALMEGRREVFLRIQEFLSLNADQMLEKYTKSNLNDQEEPNK